MRLLQALIYTIAIIVLASIAFVITSLSNIKQLESLSKQTLPEGKMVKDLKNQVKQLRERLEHLESVQAKFGKDKAQTRRGFVYTKQLPSSIKRKILITGGAGFVGSHLLDRLLNDGHEVIVADNFDTGRRSNIEHWFGHPNFELLHHDIVTPLFIKVDEIYHLASPASPPHYMQNAVKTIKVNTIGTLNMLGLAKRVGARFLLASTSEIYGDPEVHPQSESYWGHVNSIGPRSCYDESKRVAESLTYAYAKHNKLGVRVARIFNTYGPRMHVDDGRVVSNFITQALRNESLTIYGSGEQTRSFQYISDLIEGLVRLMASNYTLPVNLGNPDEYSISTFAGIVIGHVRHSPNASVVHHVPLEDDPRRRRPDISLAKRQLAWQPNVSLARGLRFTIDYFREELKNHY